MRVSVKQLSPRRDNITLPLQLFERRQVLLKAFGMLVDNSALASIENPRKAVESGGDGEQGQAQYPFFRPLPQGRSVAFVLGSACVAAGLGCEPGNGSPAL